MTRKKRLRRVLIICCHCLRNLSFYRTGWSKGSLIFKDDFWTTVNGNFMDICVLEWCKVFADQRGRHYWQKVITDTATFNHGLLKKLQLSKQEFRTYIDEVRKYRDKFIAHLDEDEIMCPPVLDVMKNSSSYLYDYLLANEDEGAYFTDAPAASAAQLFSSFTEQAKSVYIRQITT